MTVRPHGPEAVEERSGLRMVDLMPSEVVRLRCRIPGSVAEWLAIQERLAELEGR